MLPEQTTGTIFKELYSIANTAIFSNVRDVTEYNLYTIEELAFTAICIELNHTVISLEGGYVHHQGRLKNNLK